MPTRIVRIEVHGEVALSPPLVIAPGMPNASPSPLADAHRQDRRNGGVARSAGDPASCGQSGLRHAQPKAQRSCERIGPAPWKPSKRRLTSSTASMSPASWNVTGWSNRRAAPHVHQDTFLQSLSVASARGTNDLHRAWLADVQPRLRKRVHCSTSLAAGKPVSSRR